MFVYVSILLPKPVSMTHTEYTNYTSTYGKNTAEIQTIYKHIQTHTNALRTYTIGHANGFW